MQTYDVCFIFRSFKHRHSSRNPEMSLFTSSLIIDLLLLLISLFCAFYVYVMYAYKYWENRGVRFDKPKFPFGLLTDTVFLKKSFSEVYGEAYTRINNDKFIGYFSLWSPGIIVKDLEIIKNIMVKDFNYFQDRGIYYNEKVDPLSAHLFAMEGSDWKQLRYKLTPTYTSGKMKMMFDIIVKCGEELQNYIVRQNSKNESIEWKDVFGRYGCTVIAQTAFGLESNSFENNSSKFYNMIRLVLEPSFIQMFRFSLSFFARNLAELLNMRLIPKHVSDFYMGVVREMVHYRETNRVTRNDFMQLLIQLKNKGTLQNIEEGTKETFKDSDMTLTMNQISAQAFIFFLAGFETTSNTMSFCIYELALNPDVQRKLQEEVDLLEGELTYYKIKHMKYLDMVVNETLRKYPALGFINRVCTQDYKMPESDLVIESGTIIIIPVHGLHKDPELYPEPQKFNPERFSEENINKIKPFSYLPFGEGPRNCIGMRFGKMQVKVGLIQLLKKFEFQVDAKTPMTVVLEPKTLTTTASGGMWLKAVDRHH